MAMKKSMTLSDKTGKKRAAVTSQQSLNKKKQRLKQDAAGNDTTHRKVGNLKDKALDEKGAQGVEGGVVKRSKAKFVDSKDANGQHQHQLKVKKTTATKASSQKEKLTKKEQKQQQREKKAKHNKNFALTQEVIQLWERMRQRDVTKAEKSKLITKVLAKVQGRIAELAASHVSSRIVQSCAKYGTAAERKAMLEEINPKFLEVSKSLYGHFVAQKLVATAGKGDIAALVRTVNGQVPHLLRHPCAAGVITELYDRCNVAQKDTLAAEFYGKNFIMFQLDKLQGVKSRPGGTKLSAILSAMEPAKRRDVIVKMSTYVLPIVDKGLVDSPIVHRLIYEYLESAPASAVRDVVEMLSGDMMMRMVHTKEGAGVGCMVLSYGTPKARKKAVRAMKGHVMTMAVDDYAHLVLITALSVLDDTTLLKKVIISELQAKLQDVVSDKHAYRVLAQLLNPDCSRYLPPFMLALVRPPIKRTLATQNTAGATSSANQDADAQVEAAAEGNGVATHAGSEDKGEGSSDEDEEDDNDDEEGTAQRSSEADNDAMLGCSRKDPLLRRRELLGSGESSLAASLCQTCRESVGQLLRTAPGSAIVVEVARGGRDGVLADAVGPDELRSMHDSLAACAAEQDGEEGGVLTDYFGSRALRLLVLSSSDEGKHGAGALAAVEKLWAKAIKPRVGQLISTHAAKVVAAFFSCGSTKLVSVARKEVQKAVNGDAEEWAASLVHRPAHS